MQIRRPLSVVQTSENPGPDGRASKQRNLGRETETQGLEKQASASSAASMRAASECVRVAGAESFFSNTPRTKRAPASSCCGWAGSHPWQGRGPGARWKLPILLHELFCPDPQPNQPTNPNQPARPRETAEPLLPQKGLYTHAFTVYRGKGAAGVPSGLGPQGSPSHRPLLWLPPRLTGLSSCSRGGKAEGPRR